MAALESLRRQCLKELKVQPLQDLWKGAKNSFDSHHYPDAVQDLTAAVDEIEQNMLAVTLLKRAVAYSCQGNFEAGIKDTYMVMKLAPHFFEGYFCAGSLLQLTGQYNKALAVYTEGIGAVSGQCSEYEQLIRAKRAVEANIREANTVLFKKLPYELLAHIFGDLLSFEDRLECMFTCQAWQDFFLEDLPRASHQIVLGNMPKSFMDRLAETVSTSRQADLPTRGLQTYQVSIMPGIRPLALQNALNLLSQDSWHGRIRYLDIYAELPFVTDAPPMLDGLLQQNSESLKRLTRCRTMDLKVAVHTLDLCAKLSHLVITRDHSSLVDDTSSIITHHGVTVTNISHPSVRDAVSTRDQRRRMLATVSAHRGPNTLAVSANSSRPGETQMAMVRHQRALMEQYATMEQRQMALMEQRRVLIEQQRAMAMRQSDLYQQSMLNNYPQTHHTMLKRLELVCMQTRCFLEYSFWQKVPNLQHLSIKGPLDSADHLQSIAQSIGKYCLKLKTFRYGTGWENTFCNKNGVTSVMEEAQEREEGIREIIVRAPPHSYNLSNMNNAMIIPSLLSERKNYGALTMLVLQMEALGATELQTLTNLYLPRLKELQLHQYYYGESYKIRPEHFAGISRNFSALEKIVLNNIQSTDEAVFELRKARQLRRAHLRVVNVPDLDAGFAPQRTIPLNQGPIQFLAEARHAGTLPPGQQPPVGIFRGAAARGPLPFVPARDLYLKRYYDTSLNVYTKFISSFTMLREVSLCGPTVQDVDLCSLVANNRNLSAVNLIYCRSITSSGICSAFNYHGDGISPSRPSTIHQITLVYMEITAEVVVSSLAKIPSLRRLTMVGCTHQDSEDAIRASLKCDLSRKTTLEVYCLHNLTTPEGALYECVPGQQSATTRSVPNIPIIKHIIDFL